MSVSRRMAACRMVLACGLLVGLAPAGVRAAPPEGLDLEVLRLWSFHNNAGHQWLAREDYPRAYRQFKEAINILQPHLNVDRRLMARSYADLARVLYLQNRHAEAEPLARWALEVRKSDRGVKPESVFQSLYLLALIERSQKQFEPAETHLREALTIQQTAIGTDHYEVSQTLDDIAGVCRDQGKYPVAEALYLRVLATREQVQPTSNPDLADTIEHYAILLRRANRAPEAEAQEARAATIRDTIATLRARAEANRASAGLKSPR